VGNEVFRIECESQDCYEKAKVLLKRDVSTLRIGSRIYAADDDSRTILFYQSHYYLRTLLRGTNTSDFLGLDHGTFQFFTNQWHDGTRFRVVPNVALYMQERAEALAEYLTLPRAPISKTTKVVNEDGAKASIIDLLDFPIACVGEQHHQEDVPKVAMIRNIDAIKGKGTILLMEHLDASQNDLLKPGTILPPDISRYLLNMDASFGIKNESGTLALVTGAIKHGVRVCGIESPFALDAGAFGAIVPLPGTVRSGDYSFNSFDRLLMFNYNAVRAAKQVRQAGGKALVFCGSSHIGDYTDATSGRTVTGLARVFGCPNYAIGSALFGAGNEPHSVQAKSFQDDCIQPKDSWVRRMSVAFSHIWQHE
jgi:hypothetical protein